MPSKRPLNIILVIFLATMVYLTGYFRTSVFVGINALSSSVYYHDVKPEIPGYLSFIKDKSYPELLHLKEVLTLAFVGVFCALTLASLYLLFRKGFYLQVCLVFYAFLLMVALIIGGIGIALPGFYNHAYNISRNLLHIAQSPFTVLFLVMIAYYHKSTQA